MIKIKATAQMDNGKIKTLPLTLKSREDLIKFAPMLKGMSVRVDGKDVGKIIDVEVVK